MSIEPGKLYPGGTEPIPGYINRPGTIYAAGAWVNTVEQKWRNIIATTTMIDQSVNDFLQIDVARLIAIARAAYQVKGATNAEKYRQALSTLMAELR